LESNIEDGKPDSLNESQQTVSNFKNKSLVWSCLLGAVGGALVVGVVWGIVAHTNAGSPVVAKVGNTVIDQASFTAKMESGSGKQTLQEMISEQLINAGAQKYHITAEKQDTDAAQTAFEAQYGVTSPDQLTQFLAQNNLSTSDFQDLMRVQVLEQKLAERNIPAVSDKDIQSYYDAHKANFTKQGSSTPEPLSTVRSQIIDSIKQSKALPAAQLLASLAKENPITILDAKYATLKDQIENPAPSTATGP
jgi:parvulin-like peptidyl-prolyl isomerase